MCQHQFHDLIDIQDDRCSALDMLAPCFLYEEDGRDEDIQEKLAGCWNYQMNEAAIATSKLGHGMQVEYT